ncbi:MAG: hypothetical protein JKY65_22860 [Planctomycetes bacterium]|nr:hypothetical protein [Planctomycetota bacterium]
MVVRRASRTNERALWALSLLALALSGCQSGPPPRLANDPELEVSEGERIELRTDLPPEEAKTWLARLERLAELLDGSLAFCESPAKKAVCVVLGDAARFALYAQARKIEASAGAFVTAAGEVVYRYRVEDWQVQAGPPYPIEPLSRPIASALLRARLLRTYGPGLEATWVEEGLAQRFSALAAQEIEGRPKSAKVHSRQRLIDAFLPLHLGGSPVLGVLLQARGKRAMKKKGSPALAWAGVGFLASSESGGKILASALADAAGQDGADEAFRVSLEATRSLERPFERYLLDETLAALLEAVRTAPTPVDRWESAAVLRLIANLDLDPDLPDEKRTYQVDASIPLLEESPPPVRFLDRYQAELRAIHGNRSQLDAMRRLLRRVRREFTRRTQGYGHPAIEVAQRGLGAALQRAYRDAAP